MFYILWSKAKYIEEGMALPGLFTFWRGWGDDVTVILTALNTQQGKQMNQLTKILSKLFEQKETYICVIECSQKCL